MSVRLIAVGHCLIIIVQTVFGDFLRKYIH